jgi:hypothetical protein
MQRDASVSETEFNDLELGDRRLNRRVKKVAATMELQPDVGFPTAMTTAELEGFYRLVNHKRVDGDALLAPHVRATVDRCAAAGTVVVAQDTTMFSFSTPREGLGAFSGRCFFSHVALAIDETGHPLGVLGLASWARVAPTISAQRKRKKVTETEAMHAPNEQDRWIAMVDTVEGAAAGRASVVHVMDTEADDYDLLQQLVADGRRFVIRGGGDRRLIAGDGAPGKMKEVVASCPVQSKRSVRLSRRRQSKMSRLANRPRQRDRDEREAQLSIGAAPICVRAPNRSKNGPKALDLHVVCVREDKPPEGVEPVEWVLMTTEPIDNEEQLLAIVDMYRNRWKIEEFFKAIKTGCAYEKRQFESYQALTNVLAMLIPIAWNLLRLRTTSRRDAKRPASTVLSEPELEVLRKVAEKPLPKNPTLEEAMLSIARLGGHLKRNGRPGWQTLSRGYFKLVDLVAGYLLAQRYDLL